jgi:hypothetical protein
MWSLVSLAAKQAAKEEELAAARTQVGAAHSNNHIVTLKCF